jgi:hypothetical protein
MPSHFCSRLRQFLRTGQSPSTANKHYGQWGTQNCRAHFENTSVSPDWSPSILLRAALWQTDSRTRRYMFVCLSYFWDEGTEIPSENSHLKVLILKRGDIARTSWRVFVVLASLLRQSPARRQWLRHALHEFLFVPICSQGGQWVNHTISDSLPWRLAQDQHNRCRLVHYSADGTDSIKSELGREYTYTISIASDMLIRWH